MAKCRHPRCTNRAEACDDGCSIIHLRGHRKPCGLCNTCKAFERGDTAGPFCTCSTMPGKIVADPEVPGRFRTSSEGGTMSREMSQAARDVQEDILKHLKNMKRSLNEVEHELKNRDDGVVHGLDFAAHAALALNKITELNILLRIPAMNRTYLGLK